MAVVLAIVLFAMTSAFPSPTAAVVLTGVLGVAAFATVAPLQLRVLQKAQTEGQGAGQNLASSLNIAAFNLGNALGAWLGGYASNDLLAVVFFGAAAGAAVPTFSSCSRNSSICCANAG